ncbi:Membrane-spanning protein [Entamoeba marina]
MTTTSSEKLDSKLQIDDNVNVVEELSVTTPLKQQKDDRNIWKHKAKIIKAICIGQILCFLNASTYAMTSYLGQNSDGATALIQSISIYWTLPIVLIIVSYKYGAESVVSFLHGIGLRLGFGIAVCDILGSMCLIFGIQMTNVLSAQLLGVCSIPFVMICSYFLLKRKGNWYQLISAIVAITGFIVITASDGRDGHTQLIGDVLCLLSSLLFAIANTLQEYTINVISPFSAMNYIIILSVYGPLVTTPFCLLFIFVPFKYPTDLLEILVLIAYPFSQLVLYSCIPFIILYSSATFFNISNLSSTVYGMGFDIFLFKKYPTLLSIGGGCCIFLSVFIYSIGEWI